MGHKTLVNQSSIVYAFVFRCCFLRRHRTKKTRETHWLQCWLSIGVCWRVPFRDNSCGKNVCTTRRSLPDICQFPLPKISFKAAVLVADVGSKDWYVYRDIGLRPREFKTQDASQHHTLCPSTVLGLGVGRVATCRNEGPVQGCRPQKKTSNFRCKFLLSGAL